MKLVHVNINEEFLSEYLPGTTKLKTKVVGNCTFKGEKGKMSFELTEEDIESIQQVLMYRCKELSGEV